MVYFLLETIIIAIAMSAGGAIALFTAKEIKQYKGWIIISEAILAAIIAGLLINLNAPAYWILLPVGVVSIILIDKLLPKLQIDSLFKMLFLGICFGIVFQLNIQYAMLFAVIASMHNIIKGSRIGEALMRQRKNVFKEISFFQVVFILGALTSYYFCTRDLGKMIMLNFGAGAILASFCVFRK